MESAIHLKSRIEEWKIHISTLAKGADPRGGTGDKSSILALGPVTKSA